MTGTFIYEPPEPHSCDTPQDDDLVAGTVWQCECGTDWLLEYWWVDWSGSIPSWVKMGFFRKLFGRGWPKR